MSLEKLLNYSVDNTVINHYLYLLAERDVKAAEQQADLMERLRLSDEALVEACGSFRLAQEAKAKVVELALLKQFEVIKNLEEVKSVEKLAFAKNKVIDKPKSNKTDLKNGEKHIGQFVLHNDGTLLDTKTGLMWCRYSIGQDWKNGTVVGDAKAMVWNKAKKIPNDFNSKDGCGGFYDWRLPSIDEFPIIESKDKAKIIMSLLNVFPHDSKQFWSSSETNYNFIITASLVRTSAKYKTTGKTATCYVRLVRNV